MLKKSKKPYANRLAIGAIFLALAIVLTGFYWAGFYRPSARSSTTPQQQASPAIGSRASLMPSPTAPKQTGKSYAASAGSESAGVGGGGAATSPSTSNTLAAPTGQLLNKQVVSLSSDNAETNPSLQSVCQALANATCNIRLTNGSTVKYVGTQSTGSNGMVIFNWSAKTIGLTPGQWTVQAVVTQGNATGVSHNEYLTVQS